MKSLILCAMFFPVALVASEAATKTNGSAVIQENGKILSLGLDGNSSANLIRLNPDGTLDETFGGKGRRIVGSGRIPPNSLELTKQQKILVSRHHKKAKYTSRGFGGTSGSYQYFDLNLGRMDNRGWVDNTFGDKGYIISDLGHFEKVRVSGILTQSDDRIVVSATLREKVRSILLFRYLPNGTVDPSFGDKGKVQLSDTLGQSVTLLRTAILPDNKILLHANVARPIQRTLLFRLDANGSLDESFGDKGHVSFTSPLKEYFSALGVDLDGRILLGGRSSTTGIMGIAVRRFTSSGKVDTSFGLNGIVYEAGYELGRPVDFQFLESGRILVASEGGESSQSRAILIGLNENGSRWMEFGKFGLVKSYFQASPNRSVGITKLLKTSPNKILLVGTCYLKNQDHLVYSNCFEKYDTRGKLDPSFGNAGAAIIPNIAPRN